MPMQFKKGKQHFITRLNSKTTTQPCAPTVMNKGAQTQQLKKN